MGGERSISNALISSINAGSSHSVDFGIISPWGLLYAEYNIKVTFSKNGVELASKDLTTPAGGSKSPDQSIPVDQSGFTADDALTVDFEGSFTCAKGETPGKAGIAYSMSWSPGGPRLIHTP